MNKASMDSFRYKKRNLRWQKQMILNEATGMISRNEAELTNWKAIQLPRKTSFPALKELWHLNYSRNLKTILNLFVVLDAWEALNMAQIEKLDKLQSIWTHRWGEKQLENSYEQIFEIQSGSYGFFNLWICNPIIFCGEIREAILFFQWGNLPAPMPEDSVLVINQRPVINAEWN
jgi:hypothetical protein